MRRALILSLAVALLAGGLAALQPAAAQPAATQPNTKHPLNPSAQPAGFCFCGPWQTPALV